MTARALLIVFIIVGVESFALAFAFMDAMDNDRDGWACILAVTWVITAMGVPALTDRKEKT